MQNYGVARPKVKKKWPKNKSPKELTSSDLICGKKCGNVWYTCGNVVKKCGLRFGWSNCPENGT